MNNIDFIKKSILNSYLVSFGFIDQFIELRFDNSNFYSIKVNLDCKIRSSDIEYNTHVESFCKYSEIAFPIAYFIGANLKKVVDCEISKKLDLVVLKFENRFDLLFDISEQDTDFAITFWDKSNPNLYDGFSISSGEIEKSNPLI